MHPTQTGINWEEITQEIQEEFSAFSEYESRVIDSYLLSGNWIEGV